MYKNFYRRLGVYEIYTETEEQIFRYMYTFPTGLKVKKQTNKEKKRKGKQQIHIASNFILSVNYVNSWPTNTSVNPSINCIDE